MLARTGNLKDVYRAFEQAEIEITEAARVTGHMEAEIVEGDCADWFLVQAFPGDDLRAMRWLARRRFGVFRPMQQRVYKPRGIAVQGWEAVFPGWLFVYTWGIRDMQWRILACPGVMDILRDPVSRRPLSVNEPDEEDGIGFVDRLQARAWVYNENAPHTRAFQTHVSVTANRHRKRRRRPGNRIRKAVRADNGMCESPWTNANQLEPDQRIALLKATILPPVVGSMSSGSGG